jgi:hypothetical protein
MNSVFDVKLGREMLVSPAAAGWPAMRSCRGIQQVQRVSRTEPLIRILACRAAPARAADDRRGPHAQQARLTAWRRRA